MNLQSILAITDLSAQGNRTVFRAATLAAQHRASLQIMYAPRDFAAPAVASVNENLRRLAAEVHTRFDILVKAVSDISGQLVAVAEHARWSDLLVIGGHRGTSAKAFFCGQPVERLQRVVSCPILIARVEVFHRYRSILVAVDFTPESRKLLRLAQSVDNDAQIELFHVLNTTHRNKLRYAEVSERAIRAYRHECMRDAHERLFLLSNSSVARRSGVHGAIGWGDAARQMAIRQQHTSAELLVVGKRRNSAFSDFLFGSVAQRLLMWSSCDILVVPERNLCSDPKTENAASSKVQLERATARRAERRTA